MRVLGIDPGSHKTGWGAIEVEGSRVSHVDNGVIFLDDDGDLTVRLVELKPDVVVVEDVFVRKGARSALILGQARGVVLATCGMQGLPVRSVPTSQVKLRVAGRGRADKVQVAEMVRALLGLPELPFEDAADALAVALSAVGDVTRPASPPARPRKKSRGRDALLELARAQGKA